MGHGFANGANRPQSRIVFIGMWMLFGGMFILNLPAVYFCFLAVLSLFVPFKSFSTDYGFIPLFTFLLFVLALEVLCVFVLVRVTKNYRKRRITQPLG